MSKTNIFGHTKIVQANRNTKYFFIFSATKQQVAPTGSSEQVHKKAPAIPTTLAHLTVQTIPHR